MFQEILIAGQPPFGINANGGTARSQGLEAMMGWTPVTGLTFTLIGAYVDAYLTSAAPDAGGNDGDRLPYVPKWSSSLDGAYTWRAFRQFDAMSEWYCRRPLSTLVWIWPSVLSRRSSSTPVHTSWPRVSPQQRALNSHSI